MVRSYKYRLYPNKQQRIALSQTLAIHRLLYNQALEQRISLYKNEHKSITYNEQWKHFRDIRRENDNILGLINASSLQHTLRKLDKAFRRFFKHLKTSKKAGFPRFKSENRFKSFEYTYGDGAKFIDSSSGQILLRLQNIGTIKVKLHRHLPQNAKIKHIIVKKHLESWYVIVQVDVLETTKHSNNAVPKNPVGLDMGLHYALALSNNSVIENPKYLKKAKKKLRRLQRKYARQKQGSKRRRKTKLQIAKMHTKIANQRRDFWHKTTRWLVNTFDFIALENLSLGFMLKNRHTAFAAYDVGLGMFRQLLQYKAEEAGIEVAAISPAYTSQLCSACGAIVEKPLSQRIHRCTCGVELDRDVNAALVILKHALNNANLPPGLGGQDITHWDAAPRALRSHLL